MMENLSMRAKSMRQVQMSERREQFDTSRSAPIPGRDLETIPAA
jgi:hypothetical protein